MNRTRSLVRLVALVGAAAMALSACGGGKSKSSSSQDTSQGGSSAATVSIVDQGGSWAFTPGDVTVTPGATVKWTNNSSAPHNVTFDDSSIKSSEIFNKPKSFSTTFAKAGSFTYKCTIHPQMTGTVKVS